MRIVLFIVFNLFVIPISLADTARPVYRSGPLHRNFIFEGISQNPEYEFYLRFIKIGSNGTSDQTHFERIVEKKTIFPNTSDRIKDLQVIAVPKAEIQRLKELSRIIDPDQVAGHLTASLENAQSVEFVAGRAIPEDTGKTLKYTLNITEGKLTVKPVEASKENESILVNSSVVPMWVIGILVGVAVMLFGVWVGRKSKSFSQPPVNPCSPTEPK